MKLDDIGQKIAATREEQFRKCRETRDELLAAISDPVTVHVNMLRGTIAKPTVANIIHLYGREALLEALGVPDLLTAAKEAAIVVSQTAKAAGADPMKGTCLPRLMSAVKQVEARS